LPGSTSALVTTPRAPRRIVTLPPALDRAFEDAVYPLREKIEGRLRPTVYADRPLMGDWRPCWAALRRRCALMAVGRVVWRTDVRDCFPSIGRDAVERAMRATGSGRADVRGVLAVLERIEATGIRGLPVGPRPSAFLATMVLAEADDELAGARIRHLRWVDDFFLFFDDRSHAPNGLGVLSRALGRGGLELAQHKTREIGPGELATHVSGCSAGTDTIRSR
jgi:hypothetical protein